MQEEYTDLASIHDDDDDAPVSTGNTPSQDDPNGYIPGETEELPEGTPGVHSNSEVGGLQEFEEDELIRLGILDPDDKSNLNEEEVLPGEEDKPAAPKKPKEGKEGEETEGEVHVTGLEQLLSEFNIEGGMIDFGDGKEPTHYEDLSSTDQYTVLKQLWESHSTFEEQQKSLDDGEINLINNLRKSGKTMEETISDLAEERAHAILAEQNSLGENYSNMDKDSLYVRFLRERNPEISSNDIEKKLESAKENPEMFDGFVDKYKESLSREQNDKQQADNQARYQAQMVELEEDRGIMAKAASEIDSVAGFAQNDDIRNQVLQGIMEVNENGDSLFMEQVFGDPKELYRVKWLADYGESFIQERESYWKQETTKAFNRGKAAVTNGLPSKRVNGRRLEKPVNSTRQAEVQREDTGMTLDDIHNE